MLLTIITPTYNRVELLPRLYESLLKQTDQDFQWMIIDDGSNDHTQELIKQYQIDNKINIEYIFQNNGGKHRALNNGIHRIQTQLTFIVDSDDYLSENAVAIIKTYHERYQEENKLCGYSFLRCNSEGVVNTREFPQNEKIESYIESRINSHLGGDKAEVFFTDIIKEFPFPEYEGERFLPEDIVWVKMAEQYNMVHINEKIYYSEYLPQGLTKSGRTNKMKSPKGMIARSMVYLQCPKIKYRYYFKMMILLIIYGKQAKFDLMQLKRESGHAVVFYICFLPSFIIWCIWRKKY